MLRTFLLHIYILSALCSAVFMSACTKDELNFGYDYLNESDFVKAFVDSSIAVSVTTRLDSELRSTFIVYMVGKTSVPNFAESQASFMSRFYFNDLAVNFKDDKLQLESITLRLVPLRQFLGDTTAVQTFEIYELTQPVTKEIAAEYFDEGIRPSTLISSARTLGSKSFTAFPSDSAKDFTFQFPAEKAKELYAHIRSFYSQDSSLFYNDSLLNNAFKGLYIKPLEGAAIMNYATQIEIKTHKGTEHYTALLKPTVDAYNDTTLAESRRDLYVQALTIFDHTYTGEIQSQLNTQNATSYVSGFMGLKTQLQFPDFDSWHDSVVVFNSVNIQVPITQINKSSQVEMHNKTLWLYIYDAERKLAVPIIAPSSADSVVYNFDITALMPTLRRKSASASDYTFEIAMPYNNRYGNAFTIDALNNKIKLIIRYSR